MSTWRPMVTMPRCIVSTMLDGGVALTSPSKEIMDIFTRGGAPEGYWSRIDWDAQIASMVRRGIHEIVAVKWVQHLRSGGLTDAEAYELIRDKDTLPGWTAGELWDRSEVPADWWFRDAWKRSHNGGPIYVDLNIARCIQFREIQTAVHVENERRKKDFDLWQSQFECDMAAVREMIKRKNDLLELRRVWPEGLM